MTNIDNCETFSNDSACPLDMTDSFIPTSNSLLMNLVESSEKTENFNLTNFFSKYDRTLKQQIFIDVKVEFLKFGQIETKNERFDAELLIECSWDDKMILYKLLDEFKFKRGNKSFTSNENFEFKDFNEIISFNSVVNDFKFDSKLYWTPNIVITNSIGELKEEFIYKIELVNSNGTPVNLLHLNDVAQLNSIAEGNLLIHMTEKRKVKGLFYERLELHDFPFGI